MDIFEDIEGGFDEEALSPEDFFVEWKKAVFHAFPDAGDNF